MKFEVKKDVLLKYLNIAKLATEEKGVLHYYSGVKFVVSNDSLTILAANSNIEADVKIPVSDDLKILSEGEVLIQANTLLPFVTNAEGDFLYVFQPDDNILNVKDDTATVDFSCMDKSLFQTTNEKLSGVKFTLDAEVLKQTIEQTYIAINKSERKELSGVNFVANGNVLTCVSTNSVRLIKKTIELSQNVNFNIIIPFESLNIIKLILPAKGQVEIIVGDRKVGFYTENIVVYSNLIDGFFPNIEKIFSIQYKNSLDVNPKAIISCYKKFQGLISDDKPLIQLKLTSDKFEIYFPGSQGGHGSQPIEGAIYHGDDLTILFHNKYFIQAIQTFDEQNIQIYFDDARKPVKLTKVNDSSLIQIVMPSRY